MWTSIFSAWSVKKYPIVNIAGYFWVLLSITCKRGSHVALSICLTELGGAIAIIATTIGFSERHVDIGCAACWHFSWNVRKSLIDYMVWGTVTSMFNFRSSSWSSSGVALAPHHLGRRLCPPRRRQPMCVVWVWWQPVQVRLWMFSW